MQDKSDIISSDAILVVAHPDDEALWFSSLLSRVKRVVVCFSPYDMDPERTERFYTAYPLEYTEFLDLNGFGGYHRINFRLPILTGCGLFIKSSLKANLRYKKNCRILEQKLMDIIPEGGTIFTHNPWGEYGHEEHIQVSTIVRRLGQVKHASIWHNNYGGVKSYSLMKKTLFVQDYDAFQLKTDKDLARHLRSFYLQQGSWTWAEDWEWFDTETFFIVNSNRRLSPYQHLLPINLIY